MLWVVCAWRRRDHAVDQRCAGVTIADRRSRHTGAQAQGQSFCPSTNRARLFRIPKSQRRTSCRFQANSADSRLQRGEGAGCTPARQCGGIGRALEVNTSGLRSRGDSWLHVVGGAAGHVRAACQRRRWAPAGPREATRVGSSPRAVPRGAHQKGVCVGSCLNSYFVRPGSAPGPCKQPSKCERVLCLRCVV